MQCVYRAGVFNGKGSRAVKFLLHSPNELPQIDGLPQGPATPGYLTVPQYAVNHRGGIGGTPRDHVEQFRGGRAQVRFEFFPQDLRRLSDVPNGSLQVVGDDVAEVGKQAVGVFPLTQPQLALPQRAS